MTAAERLLALSRTTGAAGALLLAIGSGATAEAALLDYSDLGNVSAAEHLLYEKVSVDHGGFVSPRTDDPQRRRKRDDETLLMIGAL